MRYLSSKSFPPDIHGVILTTEEQEDAYFDEYMGIRNLHYTELRPSWEPVGGVDKYDAYSKFVMILKGGRVVAGCRIISDTIGLGLPVRDVLKEHGLPTDQIPEGSFEISRFVIHPDYLGKKETAEYVGFLTSAVRMYCQEAKISNIFAVMITVLEKWMARLGIPVYPLSQSVTVSHGEQHFRTVRFPNE